MDALFFHPKLVHMPIALGVLMPVLATGFVVAWWRGLLPARSWVVVVALQGLLVLSGIAGLQSGEVEEDRVERFVPEQFIDAHEEAAEAFVVASGVVFALMLLSSILGAQRYGLHTALIATAGTLVVLGLGYRTGQAGGNLVYQHGAAQAYHVAQASAPAPAAQAPHTRGDDDD